MWGLPRNLKIDQPYDSAIPLLRIFPNKIKIAISKYYLYTMFTAAELTTAKTKNPHVLQRMTR